MKNALKAILKAMLIQTMAASNITPKKVRYLLYKVYGMKIESTNINPKCYFASKRMTIGKNVFINRECCFYNNRSNIAIGDNTFIAMQVLFNTLTHEIGNSDLRAGETISKPITVGKGCWIGARAVILPGVTIGDGCVIGAGAVVNKDCEPNGLYAGVPAKRLKDLGEVIL